MDYFNNALSQFSNLVSTGADIRSKIMEEQARTDMLDFQSQLSVATNNFMADLQTSNDYENWNERLNGFIEEQSNYFQKQSKNQYTAKLANEMMQNASTDLTNKVLFMTLGKAQENMNITTENTLQRNVDNKMLIDQAFMDMQEKTRRNAMRGGRITNEQYVQGIQQDAQNAFIKDASKFTEDAITELNDGKSVNEILNEFDQMDPNTLYQAYYYDPNSTDEDISTGKAEKKKLEVDYTKVKADAKSQLRDKLNAAQKDIYEQSNKTMATLYNSIKTDKDNGNATNSQLQERLRTARTTLQQMGVKKFTSDDYTQWTDKFDLLDKAINGTGSGKGENFFNSISEDFNKYVNGIYGGEYTSWNDAILAYTEDEKVKFVENTFKENAGLSKEAKAQKYDSEIKSQVAASILNNKYLLQKMDEYNPGMTSDLKRLANDINKNPKDYPDGTLDYVQQLAVDLFAGSNGKNTSEIEGRLKNVINTIKTGKLEKALEGNLAKKTAFLEENDFVNTDVYGQERWMPGAEKQVKAVMDKQASEIEKQTGIPVTFKSYEKTLDDVNNIGIFQDKDRNEYRLVSVRNEKGKVTGTKVVDANGNEVKKASENAKGKSNANKKSTANNTADYEEQVTQKKREIAKNVSYEQAVAAGVDIKPEAWKNMDAAQKAEELELKNPHFFDKK